MGRTPVIGTVSCSCREPDHELHRSHRACVQRAGAYDNKYKARIKILVKAEGQAYIDAVKKNSARLWKLMEAHTPFRRPNLTVWPLALSTPYCLKLLM